MAPPEDPVKEEQTPASRKFTTFSSLPAETRQEIWELTFTPRVLCLHIHRRLAPFLHSMGQYIDAPYPTVCVSFTSTVLPASPAVAPNSIFRNHAASRLKHRGPYGQGTMAYGGDRGPVALYVCRESRAVAMKRYSLAFGGTDCGLSAEERKNQYEEYGLMQFQDCESPDWYPQWREGLDRDYAEWTRRRLWEKRIWIDYKRDILFIDTMERSGMYSKTAKVGDVFGLLKKFAAQEVLKITKLAVGNGGRFGPQNIERRLLLSEGFGSPYTVDGPGLLGFDALGELFLDDSFEDSTNGIDDALRFPGILPLQPAQLRSGDFTKAIERARKKTAGWPANLPTVKIVRWEQWQTLIDGTGNESME